MKLQVLVSTMNQKDKKLIERMNINSDAIIINQCGKNSEEIIEYKGNKIIWINSSQKGLSRSRNLAISKATADICVIADDDIVYVKNYKEIISEQFEKNSEIDIITFQVDGIEKKFKSYKEKKKRINILSLMKISSVEIAFKRESFKDNNISFNENFGSGSIFAMGEENILLYESFRKNMKMIYVPLKIADLHFGESSWFKGYNEEFFIDRGAGYTAMGRFISWLLILQYGIRKIPLYKNEVSVFEAIRFMIKGRREYINNYIKLRRD